MEFKLLSSYELRSAYLCSSDFDINKTVSLRELQLTGHFSFSEMVVRENTSKQAVSEKPRAACLTPITIPHPKLLKLLFAHIMMLYLASFNLSHFNKDV